MGGVVSVQTSVWCVRMCEHPIRCTRTTPRSLFPLYGVNVDMVTPLIRPPGNKQNESKK